MTTSQDQPNRPNGKKSKPSKSQEMAAKGWSSQLAIFVSIFIIIEAITGLWIYLAPFSVSAQLQVILHTLAGLILLVPYLVYQVRHFLAWYRQNVTVIMILGYALMVMTLLCIVSGLILTWQAAAGTRISKLWDLVHLVTGLAVTVLIGTHLVMAFIRRRAAFARVARHGLALRRFARGSLAYCFLAVVLILVPVLFWPERRVYMPLPEGYGLPDYAQQFDEYRGSPFAPTYARTENSQLIDPEVLSHSKSCGSSRCHEQILAEWEPSAHRFSASNPPFLAVQKDFAATRSAAETRYCAGCHDPISLFAGAKDVSNMALTAPGMQEGASCVVCHSISKLDQRGNADYVLTAPTKYIWEATEGPRKLISDFLIRAYPQQHLADYDRNLMRTPEFCGACHKQFIPEALNRFGLSPGQNQYDEWRKSHWFVEETPEKSLSCRDCHLRLVNDSKDPGRGEAGDIRRSADDDAHRHHGTIATNLYMPELMKLPHWEEQVRLTREWIQGKTVIPEIKDLWMDGPVANLKLHAPEKVEPGKEVTMTALVKNRKIGHNFTTGPLDFMRVWIHMQVTDADGNTVAEWGNIDPESRSICDVPGRIHEPGNPRNEGTLVLEGLPLDSAGNPLIEHELWKKAGGKGQRVIFPKYTDKQTYSFTVPPDAKGPLTVSADLNFRRYRQEFLRRVLPNLEENSGFLQPTVTKDSVISHIELIPKTSASSGKTGNQGGL